jgi:uncharacterized damage-inducible protein DinB
MKNYFINLFNYYKYANELIAKAISAAGQPEKPMQLMGHLLAAQQVWLNRCLALTPAVVELWPALGGKTFELSDQITDNHNAWISYLSALNEIDFENAIGYKNTKGDSFENRLSDILAHVINHGTHHRAQVGQLLKLAGLDSLPITDFIFYLRHLKN